MIPQDVIERAAENPLLEIMVIPGVKPLLVTVAIAPTIWNAAIEACLERCRDVSLPFDGLLEEIEQLKVPE